ncbi:LysM domain-containing protein [Paenibacillus sp. 1_12]|uniref:LysM peptidoglycan-binding domain-containing protein n=1 Tax=Paenibacillus sp. 1_12 TaxID=1566278 RepID=UPI0008F3AF6F|nr:LysM peptidoglycan-binding domain-containing protein [Paenibacillus sp. 1_12]SFL84182.1 LysM domain-containing protein [Paenibacillus sp. 1_12]
MYMNEQLLSKRDPISKETCDYPFRYVSIIPIQKILLRYTGLFALAVIILLISLFVSLLGGDQDAYASSDNTPIEYSVEIVKGDTLWSIATMHVHNGQDVREYIYNLKKLNGLKSSILQEGQRLRLP